MTTASVAALQVDTLRLLLASEPRVARACAEELTRQLYRALEDLSEQAFLSVRQRIGYDRRMTRGTLDAHTDGEAR